MTKRYFLSCIMHLSSASPRGGDPRLMLGNTGTLWGLCSKISALVVGEMWGLRVLNALLSGRMWGLRFCSTERRLFARSISKMAEEKKNRRYVRSPSLGAFNSHTKPMSRHFYRLVYF